MIDQTNRNEALAEHIEELTRDMLRHAHLVTSKSDEQIVALVTAATVAIERHVGVDMAPAAAAALLGPTLADWAARAGAAGSA